MNQQSTEPFAGGGTRLPPGPTARQAAGDLLLFIAAGLALYAIESSVRRAGPLPLPGIFDGVFTLVGLFLVATWLLRNRRQSWADLGLRKPEAWWRIPAWAVAILAANLAAQNTLVPALSSWLQLDPPDFSRYAAIQQNLPLYVLVLVGAMITGGFMEELIFRGLMVDRLSRLAGGGMRGDLFGALFNGLPFGLIHFEWGPGGMLLTTAMGSVLGLMYLACGKNLWPLVAAHAFLDAVLITMLYLGAVT
jgi:hypothetical protein